MRIREEPGQSRIMPYSMPDLMQLIVRERAEALHIYPGAAPVLEVSRVLHRLKGATVTSAGVEELLHGVAGTEACSQFEHEGMVSFDYQFGDTAGFHVLAFREEGHARIEIRILESERRGAT